MGNISSYGTRSSVTATDRLFIATGASDVIQSCTASQLAALAGGSGGSGPLYAPGWGNFRATGSWNRPALSALTQINATGATVTDIDGGPIRIVNLVSGLSTIVGLPLPASGSWTFTALLTLDGFFSTDHWLGVAITDTANNKYTGFEMYPGGSLNVNHWTGLTTSPSISDNPAQNGIYGDASHLALRVSFDGAHIHYSYSHDPLDDASFSGVFYTEPNPGWLTTMDHVGFCARSNNGAPAILNCYGLTLTTP